MYIRSTTQKNSKTGRSYINYRLVESYRNRSGKVRQQTLLNLGTSFDFPKDQWKMLADRIEEIRNGQESIFQCDREIEKEAQRIAKLVLKKYATTLNDSNQCTTDATDFKTVDINSIQHQDARKIGCEHVAVHAARQLKLEEILKGAGFNDKQSKLALGSIIGRLIQPGSELSTHRYLREHSALDELISTDFTKLSLKNLYLVSDLLLKHKTLIENKIYQREKDLFNIEETVTLYDITNTYFEGQGSKNNKAARGRSKEKRSDRPLVALGMVLDSSGFPRRSDIFPGNISEPKTLKSMLLSLEASKNATVVMDAGFATEENISWLKEQGYQYIVVSRKKHSDIPEDANKVIVKEDKNNIVHARMVENKKTSELELYCHSSSKEAKSKKMIDEVSARYEEELQKLSDGLAKKGCNKKYDKVMEKIGRLKEKYKKVNKYYDIAINADEDNILAESITWKQRTDAVNTENYGMYCLRTNVKDLDEKTFWNIYTMLTDLESAFRSLKSELGMRPVYHQKENRVDGHIFISILAYHLLHTIRYQLKQKGIHASWQTIRQVLQTHCRITTTLQLEENKSVTIRKTCSADSNQAIIYEALGIALNPGNTEKLYS